MGWSVELADKRKKEVYSLDTEFISNLISEQSNVKDFKLIGYLDPYGKKTFNQLQMDDLISDLRKLNRIEKNDTIEKIIGLALKCKLEPHLFLTFYGD